MRNHSYSLAQLGAKRLIDHVVWGDNSECRSRNRPRFLTEVSSGVQNAVETRRDSEAINDQSLFVAKQEFLLAYPKPTFTFIDCRGFSVTCGPQRHYPTEIDVSPTCLEQFARATGAASALTVRPGAMYDGSRQSLSLTANLSMAFGMLSRMKLSTFLRHISLSLLFFATLSLTVLAQGPSIYISRQAFRRPLQPTSAEYRHRRSRQEDYSCWQRCHHSL